MIVFLILFTCEHHLHCQIPVPPRQTQLSAFGLQSFSQRLCISGGNRHKSAEDSPNIVPEVTHRKCTTICPVLLTSAVSSAMQPGKVVLSITAQVSSSGLTCTHENYSSTPRVVTLNFESVATKLSSRTLIFSLLAVRNGSNVDALSCPTTAEGLQTKRFEMKTQTAVKIVSRSHHCVERGKHVVSRGVAGVLGVSLKSQVRRHLNTHESQKICQRAQEVADNIQFNS